MSNTNLVSMCYYKLFLPLAITILLICCTPPEEKAGMAQLSIGAPALDGKPEYLASPFVTAGDRLYMVGHQDGSFPELGWHIKGEMGGIWDHPIKLMDGFETLLSLGGDSLLLNKADRFVNFPFANKHVFHWEEKQLLVERWQFVPDHTEGMVVQFDIFNESASPVNLELEFRGHSDLRPTWLGQENGMIDGPDQANFLQETGTWLVKDGNNPWFLAYGAKQLPERASASTLQDYSGQGSGNSLRYPISVPAGKSGLITIFIAGSNRSQESALTTLETLKENWAAQFSAKKSRYEELAKQTKLTIEDKQLQNTFEWLKYNCDWLIQTVPGIGTGITAGIPDYPWWFGVDSEYALKGYMAVGQEGAVYSTIALLDSVSQAVNGNGRIFHEMSTNGVVFNKGNVNETPQFVSLIWEIYQWNGDKAFLKKYFPSVRKGLEWLMADNDSNNNGFPDGFGMMEIHGLDSEMIDVASYTQRAFSDASKMALQLGEASLASQYEETAANLRQKINDEFWSANFNSYADFLGTDSQALKLIEDAIVRADTLDKPWAVAELQETARAIKQNPSRSLRPFVVHHNWVVNTPMEMSIADSSKAVLALETAEKFVNPFGLFVTGIDRDASAGTEEETFKGSKVFSYTGAVMTLPTGVLAVAENNYGRPDKALDYLKRMSRSFSYALPGSMYEVSPDYGMITQAWNIYSFAIPIVRQFFGIQPRAYKKELVVEPQFPSSWKQASLEGVKVADNHVSVYFKSSDGRNSIRIKQDNPNWNIQLVLPKVEGREYMVIKGEEVHGESNSLNSFNFTGESCEVIWSDGQ